MTPDSPALSFARLQFRFDRGYAITLLLLATLTVVAWADVLQGGLRGGMNMPADVSMSEAFPWTSSEAVTFTLTWGVMMTAMMLPSAAPMILLYQALHRHRAPGAATLPTWLFTLVYLLLWTLVGVPVYLLNQLMEYASHSSPWFMTVRPYLPGVLLIAAGTYQFSPLKRRCLAACRSPLGFYLTTSKNGPPDPLTLGVRHALYCLGCCALLMTLLVFVGAMSLPWVLGLSVIVLLEKLLPLRATPVIVGLACLASGVLLLHGATRVTGM